jgi:hypothetical protein
LPAVSSCQTTWRVWLESMAIAGERESPEVQVILLAVLQSARAIEVKKRNPKTRIISLLRFMVASSTLAPLPVIDLSIAGRVIAPDKMDGAARGQGQGREVRNARIPGQPLARTPGYSAIRALLVIDFIIARGLIIPDNMDNAA